MGVGLVCRRGLCWRSIAGAALLLIVPACAWRVVPPEVRDGVPVVLSQYECTPGLHCPTGRSFFMNMDLESGTFMDWRKRGFSPDYERITGFGKGAISRRRLPYTLSESEFARAAGSNRSSRLYVERGLAEGLRGELERRWQSNADTRVVRTWDGIPVSRDRAGYHLFANSNHAVANWLRCLGCRVNGNTLTSRFTVITESDVSGVKLLNDATVRLPHRVENRHHTENQGQSGQWSNRQADGKQSLLRLLGDNLIGSAGNIAGESQKLADDKRADGQRQLLNEDASAVIDALAPTAGLQLVVFDDIREHGVRDEVADGDAEARDKCHDEEDADFARLQEHQTSLRNEPEAHSNKVNRLLSDLHAYPAPQWHEAESGCLHRQCQEWKVVVESCSQLWVKKGRTVAVNCIESHEQR